MAALGNAAPQVNSFTGLGYAFTGNTGKAAVIRRMISFILPLLLNRERTMSLVENRDDFGALAALGIAEKRIVVGRGSGVDVTRFVPLPEPSGQLTFAFVGRLLADKGIHTLVDAYRRLRARQVEVGLLIAGTPDPANPASVTSEEAASWNNDSGITWLGHVSNIPGLWARAHVAVLPSRREGLPLSLLEAAACGRAMVATDVPGCREVVIPGETGLLAPADDPVALADAMERMLRQPRLRAECAAAARRLVVEKFSAAIVGHETVTLYRRLMGERDTPRSASP